MSNNHEAWLDEVLPRHQRLTTAVITIIKNLLQEKGIDYLTVDGRTKDRRSALEKIKRKGYTEPARQMTDLSGIRVVLYFESDVEKVGTLIEEAFRVDKPNSLNKDSLLPTNQIGYRSVHYVCDLGEKRAHVDEYRSLSGLRFEFQVRTVLQHAWAELAHDRNYKFSGTLPKQLERQLYLYAGLLEIADRGFDETAKAIDAYAESLVMRTSHGELDLEITSLSLVSFLTQWAGREGFALEVGDPKETYSELIAELTAFRVTTLRQLSQLAPATYASAGKERGHSSTAYGVVRDWMLLKDWRRYVREVPYGWTMPVDEDHQDNDLLRALMPPEEYAEMLQHFNRIDYDDEPPEDVFEDSRW